ncbi:MAG: hypothetical protein E7360_05085 [Clostridiales bacterium]|nr:hypothetical protein [Clostridiales bacterium]
MDLILEITTIIVAVGSVIVNVVFSLIMARKNKYVEITTAQRSENLNFARSLTEKIMYLSCAEYIKHSDKDEVARNFIEVRDALTYYYFRTFAEEKEIVNAINDLSNAWFNYFNDQTDKNLESLNSTRQKLITLTKINEVSYWRFIRDHYTLNLQSAKDFSRFYDKTRKEYYDDGFPIDEKPKID